MKIKTKLIASALSLVAVASVPALTAFASYQTCKNFVDNQEFNAALGTTQECILRDMDRSSTIPLVYLSCTAGNNTAGSYEKVYARASYYQAAKLNIYISFIDNQGNVILCDSQSGTEVNLSGKTVSSLTNVCRIKEGHMLIYCKGYKISGQSNYTSVNTYVNYGFGY